MYRIIADCDRPTGGWEGKRDGGYSTTTLKPLLYSSLTDRFVYYTVLHGAYAISFSVHCSSSFRRTYKTNRRN
ncbi:hypothetical protein YC2023_112179 [Brassica napus]